MAQEKLEKMDRRMSPADLNSLHYGDTYQVLTHDGGKLDNRLRGQSLVIIGTFFGPQLFINHNSSAPNSNGGEKLDYILQRVSPTNLNSTILYLHTFFSVLARQMTHGYSPRKKK